VKCAAAAAASVGLRINRTARVSSFKMFCCGLLVHFNASIQTVRKLQSLQNDIHMEIQFVLVYMLSIY